MKSSLILILLTTLCSSGASSDPGGSLPALASDFPLRNARLDFEGKKWFNRVDFHFMADEAPREGSAKTSTSPPERAPESELLRIGLETDFAPLIGPKVHLSDTTWINAATLAAERQLRTRLGQKDTYKAYEFTEEGVARLRREPEGKKQASGPPVSWTDTRETFYPYPAGIKSCGPISTPAVLLPLASSLARSEADKLGWICIFDRKNVFRVLVEKETLSPSAANTLEIDMVGRKAVRLGASGPVRIRFDPHPFEGNGEDGKEFSFAGLSGEVFVLVDQETALPFRIVGEVSGFGTVEINLQKAELDSKEPDQAFDRNEK